MVTIQNKDALMDSNKQSYNRLLDISGLVPIDMQLCALYSFFKLYLSVSYQKFIL